MIGNKIHSIALSGEPTPASPIENIKKSVAFTNYLTGCLR